MVRPIMLRVGLLFKKREMIMKMFKILFWYCLIVFNPMGFLRSSELIQALELASLLPKKVANQKVLALWQMLPNKYGVIDVPVLQQGFSDGWPVGNLGDLGLVWDNVKRVDGGNCGYHALKNILFLMNAFEYNDEKYILGLSQKQPFFDCMSVWAPMIYERRGYNANVSWLGGEEIDYLKNNLNALLKINALNSLNVQAAIVVTEDVRNVGAAVGLPINEAMLQPIRTLAQKLNGMLGVVWTAGHEGHWVGFVVYKQNGIQKIYYMNSVHGLNPDFQQVVELFSMSVADIDKIIIQNQTQNMLQDLNRMQETCDILDSNIQGVDEIYSNFTGCVWRDGSMFDDFTKEQLIQASLDEDIVPVYLDLINVVWRDYLDQQIAAKEELFRQAYVNQISAAQKRLYGFWYNPKSEMFFVLTLDVKDCSIAKKRYQNSMLILDEKYQTSFFDPVEKIHAIFSHVLVAWQDYNQAAFNKDLQRQLVDVVAKTLKYLNLHRDVFGAINWNEFGEGNVKKFKGFKEVIDAVLLRLKLQPGFNEAAFRQTYIKPLL